MRHVGSYIILEAHRMRTLRAADLASGIFMAFLGLVTLAAATKIQAQAGDRHSPATMPIIVSCMNLAAVIVQVFLAWWSKGEQLVIAIPESNWSVQDLLPLGVYV